MGVLEKIISLSNIYLLLGVIVLFLAVTIVRRSGILSKPKIWFRYRTNKHKIPDRKPVLVDLLKLLATEEEQLKYEKDVPIASVSEEMICTWFDDLYWPEDRFFISCFSKEELAALNEFDRFFDEQIKLLPPSQGTIQTWLNSPVWRAIMGKAAETLQKLK